MKALLPSFLAASGLLLSSCASIVSHSSWPVAIASSPIGATVSIVNSHGQEVFTGVTPINTSLKSGAGFFAGEHYTVNFSMPGYDTKTAALGTSVNGWYFGNILFGGIIGLLIVDPATGAMYRLDQQAMQATLTQSRAMVVPEANPNSLQVVSIDQVPENLRDKLVLVK
ncbi:hypothetical protein E4631_09295 [Hymenobacter sp. UV11]|uniref:hypothetical protein n=1 Tax=Hymenobacter sp. UV11 TaxID=1849735 RepID=UPI00105E44C3|nr:hypothetical protein [Hymenobacter sp. UV11]TDN39745.1 hypothetical protein A8B98_17385 [Hymenobacter sp. UV11]TFZ67136.1 hypothetical protein E4631_09295 [Hymenobacter sp. UV11]